jgi:hypothetical protein
MPILIFYHGKTRIFFLLFILFTHITFYIFKGGGFFMKFANIFIFSNLKKNLLFFR